MWEDEELSTTALKVFKGRPGRLQTWYLVYKKAVDPYYFHFTDINSLAAASFIGHEAAVELLIGEGEDVNGCHSLYNNALNAAALRKNRDVVKLLLNRGAIVYLYGSEFRNLLEVNRYLSCPMAEAIANS
jgi:ankyrin repeat protein